MTLEQIKIFISAAKTLSFTETANEFYTTQPTVSRQIHWLEEEWGIQLFERSKKKLFLTPEGAVMLEHCQKIERILEKALNEARNIKNGYKGTLNIGFLEGIDDSTIMKMIERFEQAYPDIQIQIEVGSFGVLRNALDKGQMDIIFTLDFEAKNLTDVVGEVFCQGKAVFAVSERHPLYTKPDLSYQDFEGLDFVIPTVADSPGREEDILRFFENLSLKNNKIIFVKNLKTLLYYVRSGKVAAVLDTNIEDAKKGSYRIVNLPDDLNLDLNCNIIALWKRDNLKPSIPLLYNFDVFKSDT